MVAGPLESLTAPPYDVITPQDQDRYHRASPYNVVRLILGKDRPGDGTRDNKYTRAAFLLGQWRERGILVPTPEPSVYPYEWSFQFQGERREVRGVIAEVALEPWGGAIIPHERTLPGPVADRLAVLRATRANLSPIYGLAPGPSPDLKLALDEAMSSPPHREVTDEQGTRHRIWISARHAEAVSEALRSSSLLIADGHHRYTVALSYAEEMRRTSGGGPWDWTMMLVVDAETEDPPVLPIHRLRTLRQRLEEPSGEPVRDLAEILATITDDAVSYGTVELEAGEPVHRIVRLQGEPPTVRLLHERVLDRVPADALRFLADAASAEQAVRSGEAERGYLLPPTKVERVVEAVETGGRMPQKSTYFWPKPRTGMVIRPLFP